MKNVHNFRYGYFSAHIYFMLTSADTHTHQVASSSELVLHITSHCACVHPLKLMPEPGTLCSSLSNVCNSERYYVRTLRHRIQKSACINNDRPQSTNCFTRVGTVHTSACPTAGHMHAKYQNQLIKVFLGSIVHWLVRLDIGIVCVSHSFAFCGCGKSPVSRRDNFDAVGQCGN